jgi:hypothetical protein
LQIGTSQARYANHMIDIMADETAHPAIACAAARFAKTVFENVDLTLPDPFQIVPAAQIVAGCDVIAQKAPTVVGLDIFTEKMRRHYKRAEAHQTGSPVNP